MCEQKSPKVWVTWWTCSSCSFTEHSRGCWQYTGVRPGSVQLYGFNRDTDRSRQLGWAGSTREGHLKQGLLDQDTRKEWAWDEAWQSRSGRRESSPRGPEAEAAPARAISCGGWGWKTSWCWGGGERGNWFRRPRKHIQEAVFSGKALLAFKQKWRRLICVLKEDLVKRIVSTEVIERSRGHCRQRGNGGDMHGWQRGRQGRAQEHWCGNSYLSLGGARSKGEAEDTWERCREHQGQTAQNMGETRKIEGGVAWYPGRKSSFWAASTPPQSQILHPFLGSLILVQASTSNNSKGKDFRRHPTHQGTWNGDVPGTRWGSCHSAARTPPKLLSSWTEPASALALPTGAGTSHVWPVN